LERAEAGGVGDPPPERLERISCAGGPAFLMPVDQHRSIHRARGCARDAVDLEPGLLEQAVEHAPGECAVRPAALQSKIDEDGSAHNRLGCFGRHFTPKTSRQNRLCAARLTDILIARGESKRCAPAESKSARAGDRSTIDFIYAENFEAPRQTPTRF
jgi:hypothetical protein